MALEQMCRIRKDEFDYILSEAMRENCIDMSLVMMRKVPRQAVSLIRIAY